MSRTQFRFAIRGVWSSLWLALLVGSLGCDPKADTKVPDAASPKAEVAPAKPAQDQRPTEPPPPELLSPVELWKDGKRAGHVDAQGPDADKYVFLDLGEGFTPILFTDGKTPKGEPVPHRFRPTYLALARGEFPKDAYGERAKEDKYLELYGIMPTLSVLRDRLKWARELACAKQLDLSALSGFDGVITYEGPEAATRRLARFVAAQKFVAAAMTAENLTDPTLLDTAQLKDKDKAQVALYLAQRDHDLAIRAVQERLECEGYFHGKGKWVKGAFDWATHEALAEFERRHRVFSWGALVPATIAALRMDTALAEYEALVRVLNERAMHAFGALEDGSARNADGSPASYIGADGLKHEVPNLEAQLREAVVRGFGLRDPEASYAFLEGLGPLERDGHHFVAVPAPPKPEYYSSDMDLSVVIDRGDVWYEFPYDPSGNELPQAVNRRPHHTLMVQYMGQKIPLASFGTTIGGWKSELIENVVWWKYKGSPPGEVLWKEIVSAPVWLPPASTPPRDLLKRRTKRTKGGPKWEVNYHETGPSYASAYGLVAAYHRPYEATPEGGVRMVGDEGIRSHGSVDYMSIKRRHSHGCHRLHNHIAVRLFSFVVEHRPHARTGHQPTDFTMELEYEGEHHKIEIKPGGYVFRLDKPIFVTVEEGRIKGAVADPILNAIPKFNSVCKAYYLPDGTTVVPKPDGTLTPTVAPADCDAGLPLPGPLPLPPAEPGTVPLAAPALVDTVPAAAQTPAADTLGADTPN
ncbi:MAG: hypothetical protein JWN04_2461 [Myxococcaceae bacterium]|nr:hypothetical protein [Myxococcaceae bacterium]